MLVLKASTTPGSTARFTPDAGPVAEATQKLEAWQSTMFIRAHGALRRLHPAQDGSYLNRTSPVQVQGF